MHLAIEQEQESDGRWLAEVLALRVIAERLEPNESKPLSINMSIPLAA